MNRRTASSKATPTSAARPVYPFAAIVGQEEMKLALLLNVIDPLIGGVLIMGHRGTGKSTAVRALAALLPPVAKVRGCLYGCDPKETTGFCTDCKARLSSQGKLPSERAAVPVVDLPLGATEDRVCGTINIERALKEGIKAFEPGLLARANRGFLYIDEVNLLEDHLIDLLLDVAVTGRNGVEREGISIEHPARFVLIGSGNPEEGELRPQLLDRFGLHVEVRTETDLDRRVQIVEWREAFEREPFEFLARLESEQNSLRRRLMRARKNLDRVSLPRVLLRRIAELCLHLKVDGHRGELTIARAARALAAFESRQSVEELDVRRVAAISLRHRLRRDPLEQTASTARIEQALERFFPTPEFESETKKSPGGWDGSGAASAELQKAARVDGLTPEHLKSAEGMRVRQEQSEALLAPPPLDTHLAEEKLNRTSRTRAASITKPSASRQHKADSRRVDDARRGRYARAVPTRSGSAKIALDATLRSTARRRAESGGQEPAASQTEMTDSFQASERRNSKTIPAPGPCHLSPDDLRFKRFKRKTGTLFIFAIDTSGSMAAGRIGQAKGALAHLLKQSYIHRDRVALISFRQRTAEVLLGSSQSVTRARKILDQLCIGGPTPLAAGIYSATELARRARRQGMQQIVLLIFTDGRANVPLCGEVVKTGRASRRQIDDEIERLGAELQRAGVAVTVVDTQNRFVSNGEGRALASRLGGDYVYLSTSVPGAQSF
jgi:magnesium chelatase subunit I